MKKTFLLFFISLFSSAVFAQKGDLFVGATGGYITNYKDFMYGINASYHLADPIEISFTGLMNPDITEKDGEKGSSSYTTSKIKMYSTNLDFRYYLILQRSWAMGINLGGQYSYIDKKYLNSATDEEYNVNIAGFNIGWHMRANITENIKVNGGWRYTTANHNASHHLFYVGVGYTFSLY